MLGYYEKPDEIKTLKYPIFIDFFDTARHYEKPWKTINLETSNQQVEGSIPSGIANKINNLHDSLGLVFTTGFQVGDKTSCTT